MDENLTHHKEKSPDLDQMMVQKVDQFVLSQGGEESPTEEPGVEDIKPGETPVENKETPPATEDPNTPTHRFKDLTEAEQHLAAQEAKTAESEMARKALEEQMSAKAATDKARDEELAKFKENEARQAKSKILDEFSRETTEKTLEAIAGLDPEAEDHTKQVANIWADYHRDIREYEDTPEFQEKLAGITPPAAAPEAEKAEAETTPPLETHPPEKAAEAPTQPETTREDVLAKAQAKGLKDKDDPTFWGFCQQAPTHSEAGQLLSMDEQIDWAVEQTNNHQENLRAQVLQDVNQPLTRGGRGKPTEPGAAPQPVSLSTALERAARRV